MEKYLAEILTYKLDLGFPIKILWALKLIQVQGSTLNKCEDIDHF